MIFPPLCLTRVRTRETMVELSFSSLPPDPGIQGIPNARLNQEFNEFLSPKNQVEMGPSPRPGAQGEQPTGMLTFPAHRVWSQLWFRTNESGSRNSKGKVPSLWDLAAAEQPWAFRDQGWQELTKILERVQGAGGEHWENSADGREVHTTDSSGKES